MSMILLSLLAAAQGPSTPPPGTIGKETVITFAANGGLRDFQQGPPDSGIVYVRDRRLRWYRLVLTGPCEHYRGLDTFSYTTDALGTFDRFSRVTLKSTPFQTCGVDSIQRSTAPKGWPGAPKGSGRHARH